MPYTTVLNENTVEAGSELLVVREPEYIRNLSVGTVQALLNPKQCKYRLLFRWGKEAAEYAIRAGEDQKEDPIFMYQYVGPRAYRAERDEMLRVFFLADYVELLECSTYPDNQRADDETVCA